MGFLSAPKAPDPAATAAAQSGMNRDTALTQQQISLVGQNNPWGSTSYDQTGSSSFVDSNGKRVTTPNYTQTTTLSPAQQAIFDETQGAQLNLAGLAKQQSGMLQDTLAKPFEFDNQDAADWAYDLGASRLDPRFARESDALATRLANQGVAPGSRAWEAATSAQDQSENDAYNQLMLNGRGQAFSEAMTTYNSPVNTITALMSGSQVSNPADMSAALPGAPGVGGVDYTGLVGQKFASDTANHQAMLGGLGGMFGMAMGPGGFMR